MISAFDSEGSAADDKHARVDARRWAERAARQRPAGNERPAPKARTAVGCVLAYHRTLQYEVGCDQRRPGCSNKRSKALLRLYGGLATTRNGRRGNRRWAASHSTTDTGSEAKRRRRYCARAACSSTAMTCAPAATNGWVSAPVPAPMSSTSSPGRTAASATSRVAHSSRSGSHPQARPGRAEADLANRHEEATHAGHATERRERPPSRFQAGARGDAVCWLTAASAPSSLAARR